jgi:tetratricopeptide (TPR) repeat protein
MSLLRPEQASISNNLTENFPTPIDSDQGDMRIDQNINSKGGPQLTGYSLANLAAYVESGQRLPRGHCAVDGIIISAADRWRPERLAHPPQRVISTARAAEQRGASRTSASWASPEIRSSSATNFACGAHGPKLCGRYNDTRMSAARLESLKLMVEQNPGDSFLRYGLAMEYRNSGDLERAAGEFRALLAANPDYTSAYYQGGQTLERLGRPEEAREMYREGVAATTRKGDQHARSEMQAALDLLG